MGGTPYPGMKRLQLCSFVKSKSTMSQPDECPTSIYRIMQQCWQYSQSDRPNFGQIKGMLEQALAEKRQVQIEPLVHLFYMLIVNLFPTNQDAYYINTYPYLFSLILYLFETNEIKLCSI